MLRVDEISDPAAIRSTRRMTAPGLDATARARACGVAAVLLAGSLFALSVSAQAPAPAAPAAPSAPRPHAAAVPPSPAAKNANRRVVSPYARAAAQQSRAGQPSTGRAPTTVQTMGKTHKSHAAAPPK